jgi:hypothetical protein
MAYVTEQIITKARTALKALNKEYGVKSTLSGKNSSTLTLTIAEGSIDFVQNYCENIIEHKYYMNDADYVVAYVTKKQAIDVNEYYLDRAFSGKALEYLEKAKAIMYVDHWDKSDVQTDYFHCAFYVNINIGRWDKPYKFVNKI